MRGQTLPRATLGEVLLSFSQGEEVASWSKGGLGITKDIMPVIMYKDKTGKIITE